MTDLVACLTDEKGLKHVESLVNNQDWTNIFLITNGRDIILKSSKKIDFIVVDFTKPVSQIIGDLMNRLNGKFSGFEAALNLVSGSGKEHMAVLAALLKLGVGVRLVAVTKEGVTEL